MDTKNSKLQYTTPRFRKFNYQADFTLEEKEYPIKIQHAKNISVISSNEAKVELEMRIFSETESPIRIEFIVEADFKWHDLPYDTIKSMLCKTAPSLLVSFARPMIVMFTNFSGFPPFNLPFIDFTEEPVEEFPELKENVLQET